MKVKVERRMWKSDQGFHEGIAITTPRGLTAVAFGPDQIDEAEQVANDLLRLVAEWRWELAEAKQEVMGAKDDGYDDWFWEWEAEDKRRAAAETETDDDSEDCTHG
jgi:hypothetical protein